jgi:FO synthase subunit 2
MDPRVILETVLKREDISAIEALMLMRDEGNLLPDLCRAADEMNQRTNRGAVTFIRSKQIYYTNVCRAECSFCSFWRKKGHRDAFVLAPSEAVRQAREAGAVKQIVIQGGLNPDLNVAYLVDLVRALRAAFPATHLHGFSPAEVHFAAKRARVPSGDVLKRLKDAGLDSLSGDGADILNDKVRKKICSDKIRSSDWAELLRTAHRTGLTTTASLLFGHVEDEIYICEHLEIIRNIQRETGGITAFEPQLFVPHNTDLARSAKIRQSLPADRVLLLFAVARIFFGRLIRNITVDWTKTGLDLALQAMKCGANDLGALSYDPWEIRLPEVNGRGGLAPQSVRAAVQKLGRVLVEREPHTAKVHAPPPKPKEELVLA